MGRRHVPLPPARDELTEIFGEIDDLPTRIRESVKEDEQDRQEWNEGALWDEPILEETD